MLDKTPPKKDGIMDLDESNAVPPLKLDPDDYRADLAEFDLTKEQQDELLQTLWNIMSMMVDLGWGLDSVQLFSPSQAKKIDAESTSTVKIDNRTTFNVASISGKKGISNE